MALLNMLGFDLFPAKAENGQPALRAGIDGTPYQTLLRANRTGDARLFVGVSGLPEHKLGFGPTERNGLLIRRVNSGAAANLANALSTPSRLAVGTVGVAWHSIISATIKILADTNVAGNTTALFAVGDANGSYIYNGLSIRNHTVAGQYILTAANMSVPASQLVLVAGREYHVEVKLYHNAAHAVNTYGVEVRVDGEVIGDTPNVGQNTNLAVTGFSWNIGAWLVNGQIGYSFLYADVVIADSTGSAFNTNIGPVMILPNRVTAVNAGGWEKEGNAQPIPSLNDNDDTSYFTSPLDDSAFTAKLEGQAVPYKPLATEVYVRASRDRDAGRALRVGLRSNSDAQLLADTDVAAQVAVADIRLPRLEGAADADMRSNTVRIKAVAP